MKRVELVILAINDIQKRRRNPYEEMLSVIVFTAARDGNGCC